MLIAILMRLAHTHTHTHTMGLALPRCTHHFLLQTAVMRSQVRGRSSLCCHWFESMKVYKGPKSKVEKISLVIVIIHFFNFRIISAGSSVCERMHTHSTEGSEVGN